MSWLKSHWVTVIIVLLLLWGLWYYSKKNGGFSNMLKGTTGGTVKTSASGVAPG